MEKYTSLCDVDPGMHKNELEDFWTPRLFTEEAVNGARTFELRDTDILVPCYPKTGQSWLLTILYLIDNEEKVRKGETIEKEDLFRAPMFELEYPGTGKSGYSVSRDAQGPRTIKTHLPLCYWKDALEKSPGTKVIQTIRNPKDTYVSFYHFCRMNTVLGAFNGTWDDFYNTVITDTPIFGDLFQCTSEWYTYNKTRENSLILFYEDMKRDLRGNIKKLSDFLNKRLSDEVIKIIAERTTFNNMAKDPVLNKDSPAFKNERAKFLRKGKVGDWKEHFNDEQSAYIDAKTKAYFGPIGLTFDFTGTN